MRIFAATLFIGFKDFPQYFCNYKHAYYYESIITSDQTTSIACLL